MRYLVISLLAVALGLGACQRKSGPPPAPPPVPVTAVLAQARDVPITWQVIGTVEAYSTVTIKSQVDGQVAEVRVTEGQYVKKGDVLFVLDKRPFEIMVAQAQATLAKDEALARGAEVTARRIEQAHRLNNAATAEEVDQAEANADAAKGTVEADKATVARAKLQLEYATITSLIDGRAGAILLHAGNLVKLNDTSMLTINQVKPIYVSFAIPEREWKDGGHDLALGKTPVTVVLGTDEAHPERGVLSFVDNSIDPSTGTIRLKASFPNENLRLWPAEFVNVTVLLRTEPNAVVVPSRAIQVSQRGPYVFVVREDKTVEMRAVESGPIVGDLTVVAKGVAAGETVVTDGQLRLIPGTKVAIQTGAGTQVGTRPGVEGGR